MSGHQMECPSQDEPYIQIPGSESESEGQNSHTVPWFRGGVRGGRPGDQTSLLPPVK